MKIRMHLCAGLLLATGVSCKKTEPITYQSKGEILGPDGRLCGQCGGYFVRIDSSSNEYRTFSLPANSGIDLQNDPKPIPVSLDWRPDTGAGGKFGVIIVTAIGRR